MHSSNVSKPGRYACLFRNAVLAAGVSAALAGTVPVHAQDVPTAHVASITMEGRGTVSVSPDMAVISASVVTTAKTADDALSQNSAAIAKVIAAVKSQEIAPEDIQTSGFGILPRYRQNSSTSGERAIVGYEVRNGIEVNIRDVGKLSDLLTLVVKNGANSVGAIRFQVSDPEEKLDEARKKAVEAARHKAEIFAEAAGVDLGRIVSITETGTQMPRPLMMRTEAKALPGSSPVPVETGEQTVSADVTIRWSLK